MAAVLEQEPKKDPAGKFGSQVDEQIAQTTSRIRGHDLALGGLVLGALLLAYATGMIVLDRYLNLAEWVRQLALAGFAVVFAAAGYFTLARPARLPHQAHPGAAGERGRDYHRRGVRRHCRPRRRQGAGPEQAGPDAGALAEQPGEPGVRVVRHAAGREQPGLAVPGARLP